MLHLVLSDYGLKNELPLCNATLGAYDTLRIADESTLRDLTHACNICVAIWHEDTEEHKEEYSTMTRHVAVYTEAGLFETYAVESSHSEEHVFDLVEDLVGSEFPDVRITAMEVIAIS